jgi:energy-converting hydrogenase Eha subunit H
MDEKNTEVFMTGSVNKSQLRCVVLAMIIGQACALQTRPLTIQTIGIASLQMLESIGHVQESVIAAERQGLITEDQASTALIRIQQTVELSGNVPLILRAAETLSGVERFDKLQQARTILFTSSQLISGIVLPEPTDTQIRTVLSDINTLLLNVHDTLWRQE